jgi:YfiH family protein
VSAVSPQWIVPQWPVAERVRALSTTRAGGASARPYAGFNIGTAVGDDPAAVSANRARLLSSLPAEPCWLRQVHGTRVIEAAPVIQGEVPNIPDADAAVTHSPGVVLVIQAADCMPVLLAARDGRAIAAAHAGWRGLCGGVIENAVAAMDVPAAQVVAWLGPAISGSAYEVGEDVRQSFTAADPLAATGFTPNGRPGKYWLDLYALARQRLERLGVHSVHGGSYCTLREQERFFSYRRDGVTGRMATLLWLEP